MLQATQYKSGHKGAAIEQRRIRSSGKTTGSVEITLPPEFQVFTGIDCQLIGQGGKTPSLTIIPSVSDIEARLTEIWKSMEVGFGIKSNGFPSDKLVYTFDISKYECDRLEVGLRDCGFLAASSVNNQTTAHSARLMVNLCHCFLAQTRLIETPGFDAFLANAVVHVVTGDNPAFGLFERDTVAVALSNPDNNKVSSNCSLTSAVRWLHYSPQISQLVAHVKRMSLETSTLDNQRRDWSRAQRIASKVA